MRVAVVTVGDELLAGDTVNTNASWLCERLTGRGVTVERITTVPDRITDIAEVVEAYSERYDAVVVTGGLGPTHDDLTMEAVAAAFGREVEASEAALAWLTEHGGYAAEDLSAGTTHIPAGAEMLPNREGVAPGAHLENVYVLPGVPAEMRSMFREVESAFEGDPTYTETLVTSEPESTLLDRLESVQERFDVSVGSYPGENVRLKLSSADPDEVAEATVWLAERVERAPADDADAEEAEAVDADAKEEEAVDGT